jgi:hypothetical protein
MVIILNNYINMCIFIFTSHHEQQKFFGKITTSYTKERIREEMESTMERRTRSL